MLTRFIGVLRSIANLRLVPQEVRRINDRMGDLRYQSESIARMLANAERDRLLSSDQLANSKRLETFGFKGYSQNDEDGIIQEIFRRIGTTDRKFIEFGTGNGLENNTAYLLCQGWSGLWLDGSMADHQAQTRNFGWAIDKNQLTSYRPF